MPDDTANIFENEIFKGVDKELISGLNQKSIASFKEGDIIFRSGDPSENVYLIISGEVKLKVVSGLSSPVIVKKRKNQFFGELEIVENVPRKSSSVADTDCVFYVIKRNDFIKLLESSRQLQQNISGGISSPDSIRRRDIVLSDQSEKLTNIPFFKQDKISLNKKHEENDEEVTNIDPPEVYIPSEVNNEVLLPPGFPKESTVEDTINTDSIVPADSFNFNIPETKDSSEPEPIIPNDPFNFNIPDIKDTSESEPVIPDDIFKYQQPDTESGPTNTYIIPEDPFDYNAPIEQPELNDPFNFDNIASPDNDNNIFDFNNPSSPEPEANPEANDTFTDIPVPSEPEFPEDLSLQEREDLFPAADDENFDITLPDKPEPFTFDSPQSEESDIVPPPDNVLTSANSDEQQPELSTKYDEDTYLDILVAIEKITSSVRYEDLFTNIPSSICELLKCSSAQLYLVDKARECFISNADNNVEDLNFENSSVGVCYTSKEFIYIDEDLLVPVDDKSGEIIAVLQLKQSHKGAFGKKDEYIIKAIIPFISDIIENAVMFNTAAKHASINSLSSVSNLFVNDIKRPLMMLGRYTEYLKSKSNDDDTLRVISLINSQAATVLELTQTIKEYSENSIKVNLVESDLTIIMDEYLSLLAEYTDSVKVKIMRKYSGQGTALIDKRKLYQAIFQIVKNACDSMPDGGNIYFSIRRNDPDIEIEIKDEGKGIPEIIIPKITQPFFSFDKKDAAGLGLSIANEILIKHSAKLNIKSTEKEGSIFTISIPAADIF